MKCRKPYTKTMWLVVSEQGHLSVWTKRRPLKATLSQFYHQGASYRIITGKFTEQLRSSMRLKGQ